MAHIGEEFGLRAIGHFRLRFLFVIALGQIRQLLRLSFERAARLAQLRDRGEKQALRFDQLLLMLLQRGDVRADGDKAAVARAPLVDLKPTPIREPGLIGFGALGAQGGFMRIDQSLGWRRSAPTPSAARSA